MPSSDLKVPKWLFKNFPLHQTIYSNINILLNITEISKVSESCLTEVVLFNKIVHSRNPTFNRVTFKGSECLNNIVNIEAMTHEHAEWRDYNILLLLIQTSILIQNGWAAGLILGQIRYCTKQNSSQMPAICLGRVGYR